MIKVLNPGLYSSIQDLGRSGHQNYGVPLSGCMDATSAQLANALLNNNENAAVLEMTFTGPVLEFKTSLNICITGASCSPKINGTLIKMNRATFIAKNDTLSFNTMKDGCRSYLAVSGGFLSPSVLSSRSMYSGITKTFRLSKGEQLKVKKATPFKLNASIKRSIAHFSSQNLLAYKGPEFNRLSKKQKEVLKSQAFTVSKDNSRMAYQLQEVIPNKLKPIITSLVTPGTIQLTPAGKLIVLMKDCQITGGYPRVLQLTEDAIHTLAQKQTNSIVRFRID